MRPTDYLGGGLGVLAQVLLDAARTWGGRRLKARERRGAPVFVMLPLDACFADKCAVDLPQALPKLAAAGVAGVMVDVWWSVAEPRPREYDFKAYRKIAQLCEESGLQLQATMSWHACGGNVGDDVNIPLPDWVVEAGDKNELWYVDREGAQNRECLSLSADSMRVLPTFDRQKRAAAEKPKNVAKTGAEDGVVAADGDAAGASTVDNADDASMADKAAAGSVAAMLNKFEAADKESKKVVGKDPMRTAVEAYADFTTAFLEAMGPVLVSKTIGEIQVGCGPCGELRYPSYPLAEGKWKFPGMGEFQCFGKHMLADLEAHAASTRHSKEYGIPPLETGKYNDTPRAAHFYRGPHKSSQGVFFQKWYSRALIDHGKRVLQAVAGVVPAQSGVSLAVKISGIHWWRFTTTRAAESAAGYYVSPTFNAYSKISKVLASRGAILDFTCLEMRTVDQPFFSARCGPRQLVRDVFRIANKDGVRIAGENALERYDWLAYQQILRAFRLVRPGGAHGFTFLRLGPTLLEEDHFSVFERFVKEMNADGK